ncbi:hypothetical protein BLOT_008317 [Blomia tropicalis]|nr:hypothetical protein BLOT_008317 [Blomia tropicalis]
MAEEEDVLKLLIDDNVNEFDEIDEDLEQELLRDNDETPSKEIKDEDTKDEKHESEKKGDLYEDFDIKRTKIDCNTTINKPPSMVQTQPRKNKHFRKRHIDNNGNSQNFGISGSRFPLQKNFQRPAMQRPVFYQFDDSQRITLLPNTFQNPQQNNIRVPQFQPNFNLPVNPINDQIRQMGPVSSQPSWMIDNSNGPLIGNLNHQIPSQLMPKWRLQPFNAFQTNEPHQQLRFTNNFDIKMCQPQIYPDSKPPLLADYPKEPIFLNNNGNIKQFQQHQINPVNFHSALPIPLMNSNGLIRPLQPPPLLNLNGSGNRNQQPIFHKNLQPITIQSIENCQNKVQIQPSRMLLSTVDQASSNSRINNQSGNINKNIFKSNPPTMKMVKVKNQQQFLNQNLSKNNSIQNRNNKNLQTQFKSKKLMVGNIQKTVNNNVNKKIGDTIKQEFGINDDYMKKLQQQKLLRDQLAKRKAEKRKLFNAVLNNIPTTSLVKSSTNLPQVETPLLENTNAKKALVLQPSITPNSPTKRVTISSKVKINGLGAGIRESVIRKLTRPYGMVQSIKIESDPSAANGQRLAIVQFEQQSEATKFMESCQSKMIDCCRINISYTNWFVFF